MEVVKFYELNYVEDSLLKFAIIVSRYQGKWLFCQHKQRATFEVPGGHRDGNESILETAKRELFEETGAIDFELTPVSACSITRETETFGLLYYAQIKELGELPNYEIESLKLFDDVPEKLTYPFTHLLIGKCQNQNETNTILSLKY